MMNDLIFKIILCDSSIFIHISFIFSDGESFPAVWDSIVVYRCNKCAEYLVFGAKR